jgi:two-component system sensor histidine kinase MtrB
MAASLQMYVGRIEKSEERERRFVADVAHELRTPLTGLSNEAQLLEQHLGTMTGTGRRAAELLIADVARLRRLVEELLEISRLEAPPGPTDLVETDLRRLVEALLDERSAEAEIIDGVAQPVVCDRKGIERVVANLIDNATTHAPGASIRIAFDEDGSSIRITVSDDGPGVPDDDLEKLFDRFFKADRARQGGSGLGLAIARRHAERMGGRLSVHRVQPHGLSFELEIPATRRQADRVQLDTPTVIP